MKYEECLKQIEPILKEMDEGKFGKIVGLVTILKNINMDEFNCLLSLSKVIKGTSEENLKYLPKHLESLNKTESTRVVSTKYTWIRDTMVSMQYAVESSTRFMNNFIRLESDERKKLPEIMENFASIADSASKIRSLSRNQGSFERNKNKNKNKKNSGEKTVQPIDTKNNPDNTKKEIPVEKQRKSVETKKSTGINLEKKENKSDDKEKAADLAASVEEILV